MMIILSLRHAHILTIVLCTIVMVLSFSPSLKAENLIFVAQNVEPKYIPRGGAVSGLCGDIYKRLSERLAYRNIIARVEKTRFPIKRILSMLEAGTADGYCGAGRNAVREEKFVYIKTPAYDVSNMIITHKDNPVDPASFNDLSQHKSLIGAYYGASSARYLKKQPDLNINDQFITLAEAISSLEKKYIDYFFYHDLALKHLLREPQRALRLVPTKFRTYQHWMILSKHTPKKYVDAVSEELKTMQEEGELESITKRYLK